MAGLPEGSSTHALIGSEPRRAATPPRQDLSEAHVQSVGLVSVRHSQHARAAREGPAVPILGWDGYDCPPCGVMVFGIPHGIRISPGGPASSPNRGDHIRRRDPIAPTAVGGWVGRCRLTCSGGQARTRKGKMILRSVASTVWSTTVTAFLLGGSAEVLEGQDATRAPHNLAEYDVMFHEFSNWGRWGADDERGTLNLITPAKVREAVALVRSEVTVSLAHNPMPAAAADNPDAAFDHVMSENLRTDTYSFTYHGFGVSHIDALCHFVYDGRLYNDVPASASTSEGCGRNGIENAQGGIVTRGVLLDIPRLRGVPYLEPSTPIYIEDIEAGSARRESPYPPAMPSSSTPAAGYAVKLSDHGR